MRKKHKYSKIANATKITKPGKNRFYFYLLTGPLSSYSQVLYLCLLVLWSHLSMAMFYDVSFLERERIKIITSSGIMKQNVLLLTDF